jgi:hypothetical protein
MTYSHLTPPQGGKLKNPDAERAVELKAPSRDFRSWDLMVCQIRDLELLLKGCWSALRGFTNEADYESLCNAQIAAHGPSRKHTRAVIEPMGGCLIAHLSTPAATNLETQC